MLHIDLHFLCAELLGLLPAVLIFPFPNCFLIPALVLQPAILIRIGYLRQYGETEKTILLDVVLNELVFVLLFLFFFLCFGYW